MAWVESYTVNGVSFAGPRFAIESLTDSTPLLRGDNLTPAMDHGLRWRRKRMGGRTEAWTMWVSDENASGVRPTTTDGQRAQFHDNWDTVMGVLLTNHAASGYDAPLQVVRNVKATPSSPVAAYRVNYGEVNGQIQAEDYATFANTRFTAQILYMDPRWYECSSAGTKTNSTLTASGNPGGTGLMTRMTIALASGTANPYIENTTTGSKLTYSGTPAGIVTFDTTAYTATIGVTDVTGNVDRTGSTTTDWFQLRPGTTNTLSSNVSYTITYTKAFI